MKGEMSKTNVAVDNDTTLTSRMINYTGNIFADNWMAIKPAGRNYAGRMLWEFECLHCHKTVIRSASNIGQCTCDCQAKHRSHFGMSFYDWCIQNNHDDWIELWDMELNDFDIHEVGCGSSERYWFKCNNHNTNHHSEQYILSNLTCGVQKGIFCKQCNSIAQIGINLYGDDFLEKYWDYEKNIKNPWDIPRSGKDYIYIKCPDNKHESHKIIANDASRYNFRCPYCINEMKFSILHTKVIDFLKELKLNILQEYDCSIIPINPQTKYKLPYDIEVVDLHLIIEVNGEQHYRSDALFIKQEASKTNTTNEEAFAYRVWIDDYKKQFALNNGYHFLEIPFNLEDNDKFKEVILQKINEINK